ncbi:CdaR family protein [Psychroserpens damuponensis]|uniref:CdaR family protein n=1 Tax=Psychroserpens damuponensis TaxID=943936 RepID=UPI0005900D27|nr:YbbR-like domain-containing protein [Psychroserpens damuponensis]
MLNSLQRKIGQSIKSKKLNVFGLFFLLAFLILVITKLSDTYVETIPFSVYYKNLPENNIVTLDSMPKVDVTVSTHGFKLLSYYFQHKNYPLDFDNHMYIKDNNYVWLADKGIYDLKQFVGKNVDVISVKPDTLILPFGILSVKKVPINLKSKINFALGYDTLNGLKITPDSVNIIGAKKVIDTINYVDTKPLNLNDVKANIETKLSLDFSRSSERLKLSKSDITITAQVEKFTEGTFDIPITLLNLPNTIEMNYFPKHIKVAYYVSLEEYNVVKPSDFIIECDYNDILKSGHSFFKPKLVVNSAQIKSARMKQHKVEYIIK